MRILNFQNIANGRRNFSKKSRSLISANGSRFSMRGDPARSSSKNILFGLANQNAGKSNEHQEVGNIEKTNNICPLSAVDRATAF